MHSAPPPGVPYEIDENGSPRPLSAVEIARIDRDRRVRNSVHWLSILAALAAGIIFRDSVIGSAIAIVLGYIIARKILRECLL